VTPEVAILGANGFIGSRLVEHWYPSLSFRPRPIVRDASVMARTARFRLNHKFADALDVAALTAAMAGCVAAVHAIAGDPHTIVRSIESVYRAAAKAGVRRLVYLSTASVHGQSPRPGVDENSALDDNQPLAYNNAKVRAERELLSLRNRGTVEVVILRPGIVYGPRSAWIGGFADELLTGKAYVVNGAHGVCNSIYVDNLIHAIELALTADRVDSEQILVGDAEQVSWRDFYGRIAESLGIAIDEIPSIAWNGNVFGQVNRFLALRESIYVQALRRITPARLRRALSTGFTAWLEYGSTGSVWDLPADPRPPTLSLERALLHSCSYKLPIQKAVHLLGYAPTVSFRDGMARSISWLVFAGYPVTQTSF
jgi:2-alkyl-3-oxoalkanoate reductase